MEKSAIWGKPYYCLQRPESMFSKQFYKLHIIKVWAYIWYFCTCFKCYNTVISDTYVPPWESRAIAVYGRKYVVQRNRILSTAFYLKKLLNGTPITEMHRGRERGQNIWDLIAEIVEAQNLVSFYFNNHLNKDTYLRNYVECTYIIRFLC